MKLYETAWRKPSKHVIDTRKSRGYPIMGIQLQKVQIGYL